MVFWRAFIKVAVSCVKNGGHNKRDRCLAELHFVSVNNLSHREVVDEGDDAESQQDQGKDHLAEGQKDDSTNADQSDVLDYGLTLVSHSFPLDPGIPTMRLRISF